MERSLTISALVAAGVGLALGTFAERTLWVNGRAAAKPAIEEGGEWYVPVSALKAAGADVTVTGDRVSVQFKPVGGQTQVEAAEGVLGDYVSNAVWRVKAHSVEPAANPFVGSAPGYKVRLEVRNLSNARQSMHGSGLASIQLIDASGKALEAGSKSFADRYTAVPAAGSFTNDLLFGDPKGSGVVDKPATLLITFKKSGNAKPLQAIRIHLNP